MNERIGFLSWRLKNSTWNLNFDFKFQVLFLILFNSSKKARSREKQLYCCAFCLNVYCATIELLNHATFHTYYVLDQSLFTWLFLIRDQKFLFQYKISLENTSKGCNFSNQNFYAIPRWRVQQWMTKGTFLTAISHRGLRNDFFWGHISFPFSIWTFISLFYLDFYFHFLFGLYFSFLFWLLFPFSIWTFIFLFYLDFYLPFLFGLLFPFSIWTFISLFYMDFYFPFLFGLLSPFSIWTFISFFVWTLIPLFSLDFCFPFLPFF